MIVPFTDTLGNKVKPGDKVVVTKQINRPYFCITTGHVLTYIGTDKSKNPGDILKDEETGLIVNHVSILDYNHYEPSLEDAENKYINKIEHRKIIGFIKSNCSKRESGGMASSAWCGNIKNTCNPKLSCIEYVPESKYKNLDYVKKIIRGLKIKKLEHEQ